MRNSFPFEKTQKMAGVRGRRRNLGDRNLSAEGASSDSKSGPSSDSSTVVFKLLAAAFYGVSSFLIVVVNKSVLTNYR